MVVVVVVSSRLLGKNVLERSVTYFWIERGGIRKLRKVEDCLRRREGSSGNGECW
jgi:hypothetical protein